MACFSHFETAPFCLQFESPANVGFFFPCIIRKKRSPQVDRPHWIFSSYPLIFMTRIMTRRASSFSVFTTASPLQGLRIDNAYNGDITGRWIIPIQHERGLLCARSCKRHRRFLPDGFRRRRPTALFSCPLTICRTTSSLIPLKEGVLTVHTTEPTTLPIFTPIPPNDSGRFAPASYRNQSRRRW